MEISSYFVHACESKASFTAALEFVTSSSETTTKLKAALTADIAETAKVTRDMQASLSKMDEYLHMNTSMEVVGYKRNAGGDIADLQNLAVAFKKFQENAEPIPYVASLVHFSSVDSRIPPPSLAFSDISEQVSKVLQRLYMLQSEVVSSPMECARLLSESISRASEEVLQANLTSPEVMAEWIKKIDEFTSQTAQWRDREQVLKDAVKHTTKDYVKTG